MPFFVNGFMKRTRTLCIMLLFFFAALTTGCGVTASVSATDLTQPVLLGKIRTLRGTDNEPRQLRVPFDISTSNRMSYFSSGQLYAGSKADSELLKLTETPDDRIVIDEVYIGSYSIFVIAEGGGGEEKSWADIKGGIYREQGHETK